MYSFLLLICVFDILQLSKLDKLRINLSINSFFSQLLFEEFHQGESTLLKHGDLELLLEEADIFKFVRVHDEAETLTGTCNSGSATYPIDVLLDLAGEIPLNDPVDALEIETSRSYVGADH